MSRVTRRGARPGRVAAAVSVSGPMPVVVVASPQPLPADDPLVEAHAPLGLHDRLAFAFRLREEDRERVSGRGHVVRQAAPSRFGLEFEQLDYAGAARIQRFVATLPA